MKNQNPTSTEATPAEQDVRERSAHSYHGNGLSFDPTKDLNLPSSYDEVLDRFKRLQGSRDAESLN